MKQKRNIKNFTINNRSLRNYFSIDVMSENIVQRSKWPKVLLGKTNKKWVIQKMEKVDKSKPSENWISKINQVIPGDNSSNWLKCFCWCKQRWSLAVLYPVESSSTLSCDLSTVRNESKNNLNDLKVCTLHQIFLKMILL